MLLRVVSHGFCILFIQFDRAIRLENSNVSNCSIKCVAVTGNGSWERGSPHYISI